MLLGNPWANGFIGWGSTEIDRPLVQLAQRLFFGHLVSKSVVLVVAHQPATM